MSQLNVEWRTARKSHRCNECHCRIQPGDEYQYYCGKDGSEFYAGKNCKLCADFISDNWDEIKEGFDLGMSVHDQMCESGDTDLIKRWDEIQLRETDVVFAKCDIDQVAMVCISGRTDAGKAYIESIHGVDSVTIQQHHANTFYREHKTKSGLVFGWKIGE